MLCNYFITYIELIRELLKLTFMSIWNACKSLYLTGWKLKRLTHPFFMQGILLYLREYYNICTWILLRNVSGEIWLWVRSQFLLFPASSNSFLRTNCAHKCCCLWRAQTWLLSLSSPDEQLFRPTQSHASFELASPSSIIIFDILLTSTFPPLVCWFFLSFDSSSKSFSLPCSIVQEQFTPCFKCEYNFNCLQKG